MKPNPFLKRGALPRIIGLILIFLFIQGGFFSAGRSAASDKTILLDESQIKGAGAGEKGTGGTSANEALPALSTDLPWEGQEEEQEDPDIAREIFRQLAQPDPSFFMEEQLKEDEPTKGD